MRRASSGHARDARGGKEAGRYAERILQGRQSLRGTDGAEATEQTARFLRACEEYKNAPDVTRTRMYLSRR